MNKGEASKSERDILVFLREDVTSICQLPTTQSSYSLLSNNILSCVLGVWEELIKQPLQEWALTGLKSTIMLHPTVYSFCGKAQDPTQINSDQQHLILVLLYELFQKQNPSFLLGLKTERHVANSQTFSEVQREVQSQIGGNTVLLKPRNEEKENCL